jgi:hypothetical protein
MCVGKHRLFEVEFFERAKDVGAELDAGADLAEFGRLFQHPHGETLARERVGRRQAADAAARNQDRQGLTVRHRPSTNVRIFSREYSGPVSQQLQLRPIRVTPA